MNELPGLIALNGQSDFQKKYDFSVHAPTVVIRSGFDYVREGIINTKTNLPHFPSNSF